MKYLIATLGLLLLSGVAQAYDGQPFSISGGGVSRGGWYLCHEEASTGTCTPQDQQGNQIIFPRKENYSFYTNCVGGGSFALDILHQPLAVSTSASTLVSLTDSGNTASIIRGLVAGYITVTITTNTCTTLDVMVEAY